MDHVFFFKIVNEHPQKLPRNIFKMPLVLDFFTFLNHLFLLYFFDL